MKSENSFFAFLGIAAKAGKCIYGTFACTQAAKKKKLQLIIIDSGLSERSKKDIYNFCEHNDLKFIVTAPTNRASMACGKDGIMLIGITDINFADNLIKLSNDGGATLG